MKHRKRKMQQKAESTIAAEAQSGTMGELPPEIVAILEKNYENMELSESEPEPEDLTLDTLRPQEMPDFVPIEIPAPELNATTEDFIKNILAQLNLVKTLNMFQSEYLELQQEDSPQINELNQPESAVLLENVALRFKNDQLELQLEKITQAAQKAKSQFSKLRQQRDFHKTKHRQAAQEKLVLLNDLRRLREHCQLYQPLIVELNTRYDRLLRQKQLSDIQRDKAANDLKKLEAQSGAEREPEINYIKRTAKREAAPAPVPVEAPKELMKSYFKPQRELDEMNTFSSKDQESKVELAELALSPTQQHSAAVASVQMHPHRPVVLSASADGSFRVAQSEQLQLLLQASPHSSYVSCARFSPSAQFESILASCSGDGSVKLFNILNQQEICCFEKSVSAAQWLDWHCCGNILAVAGADRVCRLFDVNLGQIIAKTDVQGSLPSELLPFLALRETQRALDFCEFEPFGNLIVTGGADCHCRIFDPRVGNNVIHDYTLSNVTKAAFDASGQVLYMCDADGEVMVQDIRAEKPIFKGNVEGTLSCCAAGAGSSWFGGSQGVYELIGSELKQIDKTQAYNIESINCGLSSNEIVFGTSDGAIGVLNG